MEHDVSTCSHIYTVFQSLRRPLLRLPNSDCSAPALNIRVSICAVLSTPRLFAYALHPAFQLFTERYSRSLLT
jgi:hypothetical protein